MVAARQDQVDLGLDELIEEALAHRAALPYTDRDALRVSSRDDPWDSLIPCVVDGVLEPFRVRRLLAVVVAPPSAEPRRNHDDACERLLGVVVKLVFAPV